MNEEIKITLPEKKCDPREESAAQFYATYGNRSKAYRHGFNPVDMKDETVWQTASRVFKRAHVSARVDALRLELEDENLTTRREQLEKLIKIRDYNMPGGVEFRDSDFERDQTHSLKAIAQINHVLGYDAPIKIESKDIVLNLSTKQEFRAALEELQKEDDV